MIVIHLRAKTAVCNHALLSTVRTKQVKTVETTSTMYFKFLLLFIATIVSAIDCQPTLSASCSFYQCAEEKKKCGNNSYLVKTGLKYCNLMANNTLLFSAGARVAVAELLRCQQNFILPPVNSDASCQDLDRIGLESFLPCYSTHGAFSNMSLCDLPGDWATWLKLIKTQPVEKEVVDRLKAVGTNCGLSILREVWLIFGMDV